MTRECGTGTQQNWPIIGNRTHKNTDIYVAINSIVLILKMEKKGKSLHPIEDLWQEQDGNLAVS